MDKKTLLKELSAAVRDGSLTKQDVLAAIDARKGASAETSLVMPGRHLQMPEVLAALGGGIVFIGICILIAQNWDSLSSLTRILVTLGGACVAYVTGSLFASRKEARWQMTAEAFFLIFGLTLPVGVAVAFHEGGYMAGTSAVQSMIAGIVAAMHVISYVVFRKNTFVFFAIAAVTWFIYAFVAFLLRGQTGDAATIMEYLTLGIGISYVLLGYGWRETRLRGMTPWLYAGGLIGILGSAMALGGYAPNENAFWELLMPVMAFWAIFLSSYLKSRVFLFIGAIYLVVDIFKITAEYFSDSFGWPVALVLAGLGLIAVGSFAWKWQKRI